jgi:hypothetical protein
MASAKVTRKRYEAPIHRILRGPDGAVAQHLYAKAVRAQGFARGFCPKDSGHLASRIEVRPFTGRDGAHAFKIGVWTVRYARVVHDGHGWIFPVRARVLRFEVPARSGNVVWARKVRPVAGTHYLTRGLRAAR